MNIQQSPSPNFSPTTHKKVGLQIHKTLGLMPWTLKWLQNPQSQASAHFLITRTGSIHQLVSLKDRSWSAGRINQPSPRALKIMKKTWWGGWVKPGNYLVQIEFECLSNQTYTEEQYESIVWLIKNKLDFELTDENLLEHQDTAIDKPQLDTERSEILRRLESNDPSSIHREQIKIAIRELLDKL